MPNLDLVAEMLSQAITAPKFAEQKTFLTLDLLFLYARYHLEPRSENFLASIVNTSKLFRAELTLSAFFS